MLSFFETLKGARCTGIRPDQPLAVIGDVHGCFEQLEMLLTKISDAAPDARLVFVGDLIDRGPDNHRVLARVRSLTQAGAVAVMGNHERMLLDAFDALSGDDTSDDALRPINRWLRGGGGAVLANYGLPATPDESTYRDVMTDFRAQLNDGTEDWIRALPPLWISGNVAVTHAGADPRTPIREQNPDTCIWGHAAFGKFARQDDFWVVRGHKIFPQPTVRKRIISIDTGAYTTGTLTAAVIHPDQVRFLSVKAQ